MLQLSEIISDSDFDELIPLLWHSYSQPRIALLPLLFPSEDDSPEAREKAVQMSKQVFLKMRHADPSSHWLKILDTDTGEIIGGCRWHVHESDPYEKSRGKPFVALTYPEGTERDFASLVLGQVLNPRAERYTRPHAHLHICFVHPEHRRRGVGSMMVEWGVTKADKMGVESFLEASFIARPLYEKFGFVVVTTEEADTTIEKPNKNWKSLEQRFLPYKWHCMWRPIGGKYEEGKTELPWSA